MTGLASFVVSRQRPGYPCVALSKWLKANGVSQIELSLRIGVGVNVIRTWIHRGVRPSPAVLSNVTRATRGAITASDWE